MGLVLGFAGASFAGLPCLKPGRWYPPDMQGLRDGSRRVLEISGWYWIVCLPQDLPKPSVWRKRNLVFGPGSRLFLVLVFLRGGPPENRQAS